MNKLQGIKWVAKQYGKFYLLQDNERADGSMDVSLIKVSNGKMEFYTENDGKIWLVDKSIEMIVELNKNTK